MGLAEPNDPVNGRLAQPASMRRIPAGVYFVGSDRYYPEERPLRQIRLDAFWIDEHPVTNRAFALFVDATGYATVAEEAPDISGYADLLSEIPASGSLLFRPADRPVALDDPGRWWHFAEGADWRHPHGPGSALDGLEDHPVVHVAWRDAMAYARWAGKDLPTEAEWEAAARGGASRAEFAWGDELAPQGRPLANYWLGRFPVKADRGWQGTSPVGAYPPNALGLFDMIGNVWEWTGDWYGPARQEAKPAARCCIPRNPRGGSEGESVEAISSTPQKVVKGGSFLCSEDYCQRYRPAARQAQTVDTSSSHIGFRCVVRDDRAGVHAFPDSSTRGDN